MGTVAVFIDGGYLDKVAGFEGQRIDYQTDGQPIFVQKRVDNMVGVDMAMLAGKGKITSLALLSGDSDFIPSIEAVKREGVIVTLWHGRRGQEETAPSRELYDLCDERRELSPELLRRVSRPARPSN
ncbi:MAG TPA: NYN domain-containing protein [Candidatus Eisenbacteria bacterium]